MIKLVHRCNTFDLDKVSFFQMFHQFITLFIFYKNLSCNGICKVCNHDFDNRLFSIPEFPHIGINNLSANDYLADFSLYRIDCHCFFIEITSIEYIRVVGTLQTILALLNSTLLTVLPASRICSGLCLGYLCTLLFLTLSL